MNEEITSEIDLSQFRKKLEQDKIDLINDAKRSLHIASVSLLRAGATLESVNSKIVDVISSLDRLTKGE